MSGHGIPHHAENEEHKRVGIFIAVLAVVMAVVGALAKGEGNETIVKEVKSSNGFAWYQAKRQRSYMNELEIKRIDFLLAGTGLTEAQKELLAKTKSDFEKKNAEYKTENKDIETLAKADKAAAAVAAHKHHRFEYAEISLHIAVVLCSLVLLTNEKIFFYIGVVATAIGILIAVAAGLTKSAGHHDEHAAAAPAASAPANGAPAKVPAH